MSKTYIYLAVIEAFVFFLASQLGVWTHFGRTLPAAPAPVYWLITSLFFAITMSASMVAMGLYQRDAHVGEAAFAVRLGLVFLLGVTILSVGVFVVPAPFTARGILGLSLVFSFIGIGLVRLVFTRLVNVESRRRRVLVLGAGRRAQTIAERVARDHTLGFAVVGYVPLPNTRSLVDGDKLLWSNRPLMELAKQYGADEVVVAVDDQRGTLPVAELVDCKFGGFEVLDLLAFFEKELQIIKIDLLYPSWIFLSSKGFRMGLATRLSKRLFDLTATLAMLVVAGPLMLLITAASLIASRGRGPILYHQVRVGQHGRLFHVHKFRSMRVDAEADGVARWATKNDTRITRLGLFLRNTRLDELPQIFNVLRGHMSLVVHIPDGHAV